MSYTTAERDIIRAADLRKLAAKAVDPMAKRELQDAASRMEQRGAKKAKQLGRKRKKAASTPIVG